MEVECSTHAAPQLFLPAREATAILVHVSVSLHHVFVTRVGVVQIFEGGYYSRKYGVCFFHGDGGSETVLYHTAIRLVLH